MAHGDDTFVRTTTTPPNRRLRQLKAISREVQAQHDQAVRLTYNWSAEKEELNKKIVETQDEKKKLEIKIKEMAKAQECMSIDLLQGDDVITFALQHPKLKLEVVNILGLKGQDAIKVLDMMDYSFKSKYPEERIEMCKVLGLDAAASSAIFGLSEDQFKNGALYPQYKTKLADNKSIIDTIIAPCKANADHYSVSDTEIQIEFECEQIGRPPLIPTLHKTYRCLVSQPPSCKWTEPFREPLYSFSGR